MATSFNVLVEVEASSGATFYFSYLPIAVGGQVYDDRIRSFPDITLAMSVPRGGIQVGSDIGLVLRHTDGALTSWFDGTSDPRGYVVRASFISLARLDAGDAPTPFFEGFVSDVYQRVDTDGIAQVVVECLSEQSDKFSNTMPSVLIEARTFNEDGDDDYVPSETLGRVVPIVFGATREHAPLVVVVRNADTSLWRFVAMHDAGSELLRGYVNTVYRLTGDRLGVVPAQEWIQRQVTYAAVTDIRPARDYIVVDFPYSQDGYDLFFDGEVTEYGTLLAGVRRHWLFRRSLIDEVSRGILYPTSGAAVADWRFENVLTDSSPSGRTLSNHSLYVPYYTLEDPDTAKLAIEGTDGREVDLRPSSAAYFDYDKTTSFRIELDVHPETLSGSKRLHGTIAMKHDGTRGYTLRADDGFFTFQLDSSSGAKMVTTKTRVKGKRMRKVVAYLDSAAAVIGLEVDGAAQGEASISGLASGKPTTAVLHILADSAGARFGYGSFGRIQIFESTALGDYEWTNGQSNTAVSTVRRVGASKFHESGAFCASANIGSSDDFNVLAWIKPYGNNVGQNIVRKRTSGAGLGWELETVTGGKVRLTLNSGGSDISVTGTSDLRLSATTDWHCVVAVLDRVANVASIYVDGVLEGTASTTALSGALTNTSDLEIDYDGYVDEVMVQRDVGCALTAAQVRAHYEAATGNPSRIMRRMLENEVWGLGLSGDDTSFNAVASSMASRGIRYDGALYEERATGDVLSEMLAAYGMSMRMTGGAWGLFWFETSASSREFYAGHFDGYWNNVLSVGSYRRLATKDIPAKLNCQYLRLNDPSQPSRVFMARTWTRDVSETATGKTMRYPLPFVRKANTADRIADYLAAWNAGDEQATLTCDTELAEAALGDIVWFVAPLLGVATARKFRLVGKRIGENVVAMDIIEDVSTDSYTPEYLWPDLVEQTRPDYRSTEPPPPYDLHLIVNAAYAGDTRVGIEFTVPNDEITRDIVSQVQVSWQYTDGGGTDPDDFEWLSLPATVRAGEKKQIYVRLESGRDVRIRVQCKSSASDFLSANALTNIYGLTTEEGENALEFTTA